MKAIDIAILGGRRVGSVRDIMCNKSYGVFSLRSISLELCVA
jgi:hypothetical protein